MNSQMKKQAYKMLEHDDSEPEEEEEVAVSKKARKRRNRKKKAAALKAAESGELPKEGKSRKTSLAESATRDHKLKNPLEATVAEVTAMGYNKDEVQAIVSWMWDAQLEYDNSSAVVEQLVLKQEQNAKDLDMSRESSAGNLSSLTPSVPSNGNLESLVEDEEETQGELTEITEPVPTSIKVEEDGEDDSDDEELERPSEVTSEATSIASSEPATLTPTPPPVQQTPPPQEVEPPQPVTIHQRLEMAASHQNFAESLVALMAWTSLEPNEIGALFESRALDLLFTNILENCVDYASLHGNLYGFLDRVLGQSASQPTAQYKLDLSNLLDQFYTALDQLQSLKRVKPTGPEVMQLLASRFAAAVRAYKKMLSTLGGGARRNLQQVDSELQAAHQRLQKQPGISGDGVRECFMRRDLQHRTATLHFQGCQALLSETSGETLTSSLASAEESQGLLKALMANAPGTDGTNIMEQRHKVDQVRSRLQALKAECDAQIFPLRNEVNLCTEKLSELEVRKADLLRQLEECKAESEAVFARRTALEDSIASVQQTFESESSRADAEHVGLVSVLRYAENCENLVQSVERFETQVAHSIKTSCELSQQAQISEINNRLAHLLLSMEAYLQTEVKCVDLMKKRIQLSENKLTHLAHEINEYRSLGMSKMADELSSTSEKMQANVMEDQSCIKGIKQLVERSYLDLRSLLEGRAGGMVTLPFAPIVTIKQLLAALDLAQDWDLSTLGIIEQVLSVPEQTTGTLPQQQQQPPPPPVMQPQPTARPDGGALPLQANHATTMDLGSLEQSQASSVASNPSYSEPAKLANQPPKMSWAAAGLVGAVAAKSKKSLLEIQKEELEGRLTAENLKRLEQGRKPAKSPLLGKIEQQIKASAVPENDEESHPVEENIVQSVEGDTHAAEDEKKEPSEALPNPVQPSDSGPADSGNESDDCEDVQQKMEQITVEDGNEDEQILENEEAPLERRQPRRRKEKNADSEDEDS